MKLDRQQIDRYFDDGFLIVEGLLSRQDVQPVAWIPLTDVTRHNGALQMIRGGHKAGAAIRHRLQRKVGDSRSSFLYIDEADLPTGDVVTCEVEFGSVIFLNQLIPHRSLENHSDAVRWSVDFRWQNPHLPTGQEGIVEPIVMRLDGDPDLGVMARGLRQGTRRLSGQVEGRRVRSRVRGGLAEAVGMTSAATAPHASTTAFRKNW